MRLYLLLTTNITARAPQIVTRAIPQLNSGIIGISTSGLKLLIFVEQPYG